MSKGLHLVELVNQHNAGDNLLSVSFIVDTKQTIEHETLIKSLSRAKALFLLMLPDVASGSLQSMLAHKSVPRGTNQVETLAQTHVRLWSKEEKQTPKYPK